MTNNLLKDRIQKEALNQWITNEKKGTIELATGIGKTILALHALYTMDSNSDVHLFLAETVGRKKDLLKEIEKYNELFDRDVFQDYNLQFYCYQTVYKWAGRNFGLIIGDEIHDSLSPAYSKFYFNNNYKAIIGLSATIDRKTSYEEDNIRFTKGDLLDKIAPSIYKYTINQGQVEGVSRKLNMYIVPQYLDCVNKNILAGSVKNRFYQTEKAAYDYWDKEHKKAWFILDDTLKDLKIRITSTKRSNLLFNLPSKQNVVKKLLTNLNNKTILFGNSLDSLLNITKDTVSSRNTEDKNNEIIDKFDNDELDLIASFKKLKQGANLENADNCILMSYYSTEKDIIQRIGRLRNNGKIGSVFILLTRYTQEEVWFGKMMNSVTDFNIIHCNDIDDCIAKYKQNEENNNFML